MKKKRFEYLPVCVRFEKPFLHLDALPVLRHGEGNQHGHAVEKVPLKNKFANRKLFGKYRSTHFADPFSKSHIPTGPLNTNLFPLTEAGRGAETAASKSPSEELRNKFEKVEDIFLFYFLGNGCVCAAS